MPLFQLQILTKNQALVAECWYWYVMFVFYNQVPVSLEFNSLMAWKISGNNIVINPFPHNDTFWRPWETSLSKKVWEKEK